MQEDPWVVVHDVDVAVKSAPTKLWTVEEHGNEAPCGVMEYH